MSGELVVHQGHAVDVADRFMPALTIEHALARRNAIREYMRRDVMVEGVDYGAIPGTDKPTLLKPGAEKLCSLFGLCPDFMLIERIEDWDGKAHGNEAFFYYMYKCRLLRQGSPLGEGDGSCNSRESRYRYRWMNETDVPPHLDKDKLQKRGGRISEPAFAIDKAETSGKYGKPMEYWQRFRDAIERGEATQIQKPKKTGGSMEAWEMDAAVFRVPNPDICDQVNTIQKMAQKRALVAATLIAVNASDFFTQDVEDSRDEPPAPARGNSAEVPNRVVTPQQVASEVRGDEIPEELAAIWKRMTNGTTTITVIQEFKKAYLEQYGPAGESEYYRILKAHNVEHANGFKSLQPARACVKNLWLNLKSAQAFSAEPEPANV